MNRECSIYGLSGRWKKLNSEDLNRISILLKRLERIKRITGGKKDKKIKQRKKRLREEIRIKMAGDNWKYILGQPKKNI
jgi:hypothetical protein